MKKFFLVLVLFTLQLSYAQEAMTIIKNANIFTGETYIENTDLIFQAGIIMNIGKDFVIAENAVIIDGLGKTIIPPLINAHVHIWPAEKLRKSLKYGIFANLDMHATDAMANEMRSYNNQLEYSKYYSSNAGATPPRGHGTEYGVEVPTINDEVSPARFVQDRVNAGADYIKIFSDPIMPFLSEQQTLEVIEEAHRLNKIVVGHVSKLNEAATLIEQNIDGLGHLWYDGHASPETLEQLKNKNIFVIPTLSALKYYYGWVKLGGKPMFESILSEVKILNDFGIPILCGTDAPNGRMNYTDQMYKEMLFLSQAGLTNEEVIKSATVNVYKAFSLDGFTEIAIGGPASFIIVDGNPLNNIEDIKNSKMVIKDGNIITSAGN